MPSGIMPEEIPPITWNITLTRKLTIIASIPSMDNRTRLYKLKRVLEANSIDYTFWGWNRGLTGDVSSSNTRIIFSGDARSRPLLALMYLCWMAVVGLNVLLKGKGRRLYCLGFNTALPAALVSLVCRRRFVFDNPDNVPLSFRFPWPVRVILTAIEKLIARRASIHLVPSQYRWSGRSGNVRIIANTPESGILEKARTIALENSYGPEEDVLTLYVTGKLTKERGVKHVIRLCQQINSPRFQVMVAGDLISEESKQLVALDRVSYLGRLNNEEALALYWKADVTLTYYDPDIAINRLAEPNKWGDCIVTRTPFIVNSEVLTARPYIKGDACFHVPFLDEMGLCRLIERLLDDKGLLERKRDNLARYDVSAWDVEMASLLNQWTED